MTVPSWWAAALLALAAYRLYRIVGLDKITERPRHWLLDRIHSRRGSGDKWAAFITCPWCAGFWICGILLGLYCIETAWLGWFGFAVTWLALSAAVGAIAKLLDD